MNVTTVPHLLAIAHGKECLGDHPCFYCGAPCDGSNPVADYVKSSFTALAGVAAPGSPGVCDGCVLALRESATITMIDGRAHNAAKIAMRAYSWIITADSAVAASKAHMDQLRAACLDPPEPPYAIVLSDSGQTHQIYRGVVARSKDVAVVTLECERAIYSSRDLVPILELSGKLAACVGKPGLKSARWPASLADRIYSRYRDADALIDEWLRVQNTPLGRLAAWLTPKMEDCQREHPGDFDRGSPAPTGGS